MIFVQGIFMDYAVIMAGGAGRRLWPLSRQGRPKQLLELFDQPMLQQCYRRLRHIFDKDSIFVATGARLAGPLARALPELSISNFIVEPVMRDTVGAVSLAATLLAERDPDARMTVVAVDQLLEPVECFTEAVTSAQAFLDTKPEALVTFGIKPEYPATDYGYLKTVSVGHGCKLPPTVHKVEKFVEKPDPDSAERFFQGGGYFWNSGMFVWKCSTILENLRKFLPENGRALDNIRNNLHDDNKLSEHFAQLPKVSIDYAVMEKSRDIYSIVIQCKWHDMGSYQALAQLLKPDQRHNVTVCGHSVLLDSRGNIVITDSPDQLVATIGLSNTIVVRNGDITFVCPLDQADKIKRLMDKLQADGKEKFL